MIRRWAPGESGSRIFWIFEIATSSSFFLDLGLSSANAFSPLKVFAGMRSRLASRHPFPWTISMVRLAPFEKDARREGKPTKTGSQVLSFMGLRVFHGGKSNSPWSLATRKTSAGVLLRPHSLSPIKDKIKGENESDSPPNSLSPSTLVVSTLGSASQCTTS